ncbi:hypothetical protein I79_009819 [Cricetulus griseus]|uniref:Uncharacterized protein n=1 Tax=Cricetulus griseus TaxID=10029 RepID=G3HGS8_CRIGR|nr:hypothetical protein I79_009819 [Cricetulus griseus]
MSRSIRRSYLNRDAPKTEHTNRWSESGKTTECFKTACFTLHMAHGTALHANTFYREMTHAYAHPANTSNVPVFLHRADTSVSPTITVTTQANTSDCCH